ncbi:MAG TPA: DNA ligase D [Terriglobia bacterium]|jgi:bifunctional non-homologous end joining protein LigD
MGLEEYKKKRRFHETPEPEGEVKKSSGNSFVIQKHHATRLHYDFRLEMDGVLRSWAVPKGPSLDPDEKRLAMLTEDHPLDYGGFEGVIPKGNYGAGKVIIWDNGTYDMVDPKTPEAAWKKGKFHFVLHGRKLHGEWVLVRGSRDPRQWIFFKIRDDHANPQVVITEARPESVISGKLVDDMGAQKDTKQWVTPIERELENHGMKKPGHTAMPKSIQPMLATLSDKPFDSKEWLFELKLDGMRALVFKDGGKVEMWTRNGKSLAHRFPTLAAAVAGLPVETTILDGEIVALDEQGRAYFSRIQPRIHLSRAKDIAAADEQIPVYFYAFDLLYINGYNLMKFPLIDRKAVLQKLIQSNGGWIRFADHVEDEGRQFFETVARHDLEGIVAKLKKSPYQQARSRQWLKIKTHHTEAFVIGGFTPPDGSRKHFGALLLGLYDNGDLIFVGRTGSGFDDRALADAAKQLQPLITKKSPFKEVPVEVRKSTWVQPKLVCEVKFGEWTSDRKLRSPIFQGFRDDVDPKDCVLRDSVAGDPAEDSIGNSRLEIRDSKSDFQSRISNLEFPIEFTNLDKVFWPEDGYTKGDLIEYYDKVSPHLIPHLLDRPLVFERFPNGIHGKSFYQKDAPDHTPAWIRTQKIWAEDVRRDIRYFIGADPEQLLYIANTGNIQQNPWMSRVQHLEFADYLVFDLDPVEAPYSTVQKVALVVKDVLDELGLRGYPKTSGATGIHVHLPVLEKAFTYEDVRRFAEAVASVVVQRIPQYATIERVVKKRKPHEVYVDYLQNIRGKTVASVYSPRPRPGAPVSTPLKWSEFQKPIDPDAYTIKTIFKRLDRFGDLFEKALSDRQDVSGFLKVLKKK